MRRAFHNALLLTGLGVALVNTAYAQSQGRAGIRFGAGTDISGGVAYGGQIDYTIFQGANSFELGLAFFGGSFSEDSNNGFNDYHEETDVLVIAGIATTCSATPWKVAGSTSRRALASGRSASTEGGEPDGYVSGQLTAWRGQLPSGRGHGGRADPELRYRAPVQRAGRHPRPGADVSWSAPGMSVRAVSSLR